MNRLQFPSLRTTAMLGAVVFVVLAVLFVFVGVTHAQSASAEITPSFGDGKLKILGAGFKPNENVIITVKIDSGTSTFNAAANAQGAFELDTGLDLAPGSNVALDARGDQGSGGASITSVSVLPLPQTGADVGSATPILAVGLILVLVGLVFVKHSVRRV